MVGQQGDTRGLLWTSISDFRPGIVSQSFATPGDAAGVPVPATANGAAQVSGTWGCVALPGGGLGPLPKNTRRIADPALGEDSYYLTGLFAIGPVGPSSSNDPDLSYITGADEIVFGLQTISADRHVTAELFSYQDYNAGFHLIHTSGAQGPMLADQLGVAYVSGGFTTISSVAGSPITPQPGFAFTVLQLGNEGKQGVYPDPSAPTVFGFYDFTTDALGWTICFTHENRIVFLGGTTTTWPGGPPVNLNAAAEFFNFTDPPGDVNTTSLNQDEVFVAEYPFGHGAWGSVSAGEIFLVRHQGGGYIIYGDLGTPNVIRQFAVQSTFGLVQLAAETTIGLVYGSAFHGVWVWNGGSSSTKISPALNDDFFMPAAPVFDGTAIPTVGPSLNFCQWGDWVLAPNNWLFDSTSGAWWRLSDPEGAVPQLIFYAAGWNGDLLWSAPSQPDEANNVFFVFDRRSQASSYSWTSHPIVPPDVPTAWLAEVQEVVVTAVGTGTITVTLLDAQGNLLASGPTPLAFDAPLTPAAGRTSCRAQAPQIVVRIVAEGTDGGPAPVVYSLALGYKASPTPVSRA